MKDFLRCRTGLVNKDVLTVLDDVYTWTPSTYQTCPGQPSDMSDEHHETARTHAYRRVRCPARDVDEISSSINHAMGLQVLLNHAEPIAQPFAVFASSLRFEIIACVNFP